ncbi:lysophospholipase L1-like esterase [Paraburkholderia sp. BL6669N2]|uniref:SGNH/GDSL hydrolase family protein n=1 Tax=Paraburkholderia sp. BL6669N2 TaxID=1938807 RepID=UPI000E263737|nr:SGNH/GDSL hydrolase family protein [Paraburkholderia sp. BL6669N2]REG57775.1 lysophospholipase L1-like esterase [Paraburkholderia sp. BL6669N2]
MGILDAPFVQITKAQRRHSYITAVESVSQANNASGLTFRAAHSFLRKPTQVRLVFSNNQAVPVTFAQTGAATCRSYNASLSPAASSEWTAGGPVTIPAAQGTNQPSMVYGPWIQVYAQESVDDPGTYPVMVYAYLDPSQPNYSNNNYDLSWMESESKASGGYWAQRNQAGDQATNPGTFSSSTVQARGAIAGIEALCEKPGISDMLGGDSIAAGAGQTLLGKTDVYRAMQAINLTNPALPVGYIAAGWGGQNSATYLSRMLYMLPIIKPDVLVLTVGTPNDGVPSLSGQRANRFLIDQVTDLARSLGIRVLLRGWAPHSVVADNWQQGTLTITPTYPVPTVSGDAYRQDQNARMAALDGQSNLYFTIRPSGLGDGARPERYLPIYTTDTNHPNDAGWARAGVIIQPDLQRAHRGFR